MDEKYIYKYVNDIMVEEPVEHKYPFLPFRHFKYFDFGEKWGESLIDFIKEPVKLINLMLGYKTDIALMASNPPLIVQ